MLGAANRADRTYQPCWQTINEHRAAAVRPASAAAGRARASDGSSAAPNVGMKRAEVLAIGHKSQVKRFALGPPAPTKLAQMGRPPLGKKAMAGAEHIRLLACSSF